MSPVSVVDPPKTQALAEGTLGIALFYIERGDLPTARDLLAEAVSGGVSTGANASLFHGAPALEFVLSRAGQTNRDVQAAVDRIIAARLAAAHRRHQAGRLPVPAEFDLIRGLAGLGALLLTRPGSPTLLEDVLTYLVSLARPAADPALPGWWSSEASGHEEIAGGHGNNGMAHGIAGPLALLSLAAHRDVHVDGTAEAIDVFARWLERFGGYWVSRDQLSTGEPARPSAGRPSWCYGSLGVARALQLAALAASDPARRRAAEDTAMAVLADRARLALIGGASLCHGWAGLLTVTRAIAADSLTPGRFTPHIDHLAERLSAGIDALPKPGFLEGRAGAQLASEGTDTTGWTRALLIT